MLDLQKEPPVVPLGLDGHLGVIRHRLSGSVNVAFDDALQRCGGLGVQEPEQVSGRVVGVQLLGNTLHFFLPSFPSLSNVRAGVFGWSPPRVQVHPPRLPVYRGGRELVVQNPAQLRPLKPLNNAGSAIVVLVVLDDEGGYVTLEAFQ
ncbi:hypothetical protein E5F05_07210 [Deinococcus metallilatus]|uniref:Uncharacterized protein n=1 Tax=Deinococcus metallilatus TaxID=1211322 RepID=A0AAJ5JX60_9DEIO|nr:hypothetical protein [Deinococcus metallilatus]MBB5297060.1 hypothetical protein [Deinococcus metallilatus]QBY07761.1 hypothetical protein E5F05_07210 [Deinococcus metallilatus]RXJ13461.1 hypothetical protein ERJ73_06045 [Deinococcus metallilatus]TLK22382.1 hypothetical protein FCS05_17955 [Deinococcus metallilatus]GMA17312.1 hypothetical protein GCM10025871_36430 [Deinococcus metallilatus]